MKEKLINIFDSLLNNKLFIFLMAVSFGFIVLPIGLLLIIPFLICHAIWTEWLKDLPAKWQDFKEAVKREPVALPMVLLSPVCLILATFLFIIKGAILGACTPDFIVYLHSNLPIEVVYGLGVLGVVLLFGSVSWKIYQDAVATLKEHD